MQRSEALETIGRMQAIWPHREMSQATVREYSESILDLELPVVQLAVEGLRASSTFLPSIAELRQEALDCSPGARIPDADQAWAEVKQQIARIGSTRGMEDWRTGTVREPVWSHPAIGQTADAMGWDELCMSENDMADRAHFIKLYGGAVERERRETVMTPLARQLTATLSGVFKRPEELGAQ